MRHVRKAVIPAAGLGTRFLPATKSSPKEMLPVVDKPAIQYVVEEAVQAGLTDILIITGRTKRAVEDHFDRNFELEHLLEEQSVFAQRCGSGRYDVGHKLDFLHANIELALDREDLGPPLAEWLRDLVKRRGLA